MALRKHAHDCVPVDFLRTQGFGDLVQGPKNMIKVPENGREGFCVQFAAKTLLAVLCSSFS